MTLFLCLLVTNKKKLLNLCCAINLLVINSMFNNLKMQYYGKNINSFIGNSRSIPN